MFEKRRTLNVGGDLLVLDRPLVMGIVNLTPDSFYVGSRSQGEREISLAVERHISQGARIIDLGGFSTRPGAEVVGEQQELDRLLLGVRLAREVARGSDVHFSVDTFRGSVVREVVDRLGAVIVNDISGGQYDPSILAVAGELGLPYIIGHTRGDAITQMMDDCHYTDLMHDLMDYFVSRIELARGAGITDLIIDPCFGFSKTLPQNFELLSRYSDLSLLGLPVVAALSRKSMINRTLGIDSSDPLSLIGTSALHWQCLLGGADILRAHDTGEAVAVVRLFEAFCNGFA